MYSHHYSYYACIYTVVFKISYHKDAWHVLIGNNICSYNYNMLLQIAVEQSMFLVDITTCITYVQYVAMHQV